MRPLSVSLAALAEFQHSSPTGGFVCDAWRSPQELILGEVVEVAGEWCAVRAVASGIAYYSAAAGWRIGRTLPLIWTYGQPTPHTARSGFRIRLDLRVDGGTSPLPPVGVGARVLVYDCHGDTLAAEVIDIADDRVTYRCADGLEHRGQLDDVAEVLPAAAGTGRHLTRADQAGHAPDHHRQGAQL
jgi:hypothetical protein